MLNEISKVNAIKLQKNSKVPIIDAKSNFRNISKCYNFYAKVTNGANLYKASVKSEEVRLSDSDKQIKHLQQK